MNKELQAISDMNDRDMRRFLSRLLAMVVIAASLIILSWRI